MMTASNIEQYQNACRACLATTGEMNDFFDTQLNGISVDQVYSMCTQTLAYRDDRLPTLMCRACLNILETVYTFLEVCRASDQKLRNALCKSEPVSHVEVEVKVEKFEEEIFAEEIRTHYGNITESLTESSRAVEATVENYYDSSDCHQRRVKHFTRKQTNKSQANGNGFAFIENKAEEQPHSANPLPGSTSIRMFKCLDCGEELATPETYIDHIKEEYLRKVNEAEFLCEHCSMTTKSLDKLSAHVKCHPEQKSSRCDICSETFETQSHLTHHIQKKHRRMGARPFACPECPKTYPRATELRIHLVSKHTDESPYLCSECGKAFKLAQTFDIHIQTHNKTFKFACSECPSRFNSKYLLKDHMKSHLDIKPYACDQCESRFTRNHTLRVHKRIHSGERPYPCDVCEMRFVTSARKKLHMLTHTGEKPHKCDECGQAYAQKNDLTKHLRSHFGDQIYKCSECQMGFPFHRELQEHQKMHWRDVQKKARVNDTMMGAE